MPLPGECAIVEAVKSRKSHITMAQDLQGAVARQAKAAFSSEIRRSGEGRSFADLISELYLQTDALLTELRTSQDAPIKRAEALKSIAKILPTLQQAERNARVAIGRKAVEDMSEQELERLAGRALRRGRRLAPKREFSEGHVPPESLEKRGNTPAVPAEKIRNSECSETEYIGTEPPLGDALRDIGDTLGDTHISEPAKPLTQTLSDAELEALIHKGGEDG